MRDIQDYTRRPQSGKFAKFVSVIIFIGICLSLLGGGFIGEANANAMMVSNNRPFGLPAQPTYLYILVDESLTANQADNDGKYRSGITSTILEFATAYGWISGTDFCPFVYQYSTEYEGNLQKIWPPGDNCLPLMLENTVDYQDLGFVLRSLAGKLEGDKSGSGAVEDLSATLEAIGGIIPSGHVNDSMVILVTQGSPIEQGVPPNIEQELKEAASVWRNKFVPLGVVLFEKNYNLLSYLRKEWKKNFFDELESERPQQYLLDLPTDMPVPVRDQDIWDWMFGIYGSANKLGEDADVRVAKIPQGNREAELNFNCAHQNFRLIALRTMGEEFILKDENYQPINAMETPIMNLYRWNVEKREISPGPTTWYFSSSNIVNSKSYFLYSYSCFSTVAPPPPTLTPTPTTPTPTTPTALPHKAHPLTPEALILGAVGLMAGIVALLSVVLLATRIVASDKAHKQDENYRWPPEARISRPAAIADISIIIIGIILFEIAQFKNKLPDIILNFTPSLIIALIGLLILFLIGGGVGIYKLLPKPPSKRSLSDSMKLLGDTWFVILTTAALPALFMLLAMMFWAIFFMK